MIRNLLILNLLYTTTKHLHPHQALAHVHLRPNSSPTPQMARYPNNTPYFSSNARHPTYLSNSDTLLSETKQHGYKYGKTTFTMA